MVERGLKAQKQLEQEGAEREAKANEQEKVNKMDLKKRERDAQKRQQQSKISKNNGKNAAFGNSYTIQQPKKTN